MTRTLLFGILALIIIYGFIEAWPLLSGPSISIESPQNYATIEDGIVTIAGTVKRAATFTLDGAPLLHDESGHFSSTLAFPAGGSILTFVVTDRFGRSKTETRNIFVPRAINMATTTNS